MPCIVVIEDDVNILELLRELLEEEGLQVIALPHPDLLTDLDSAQTIDTFLIDMMLPGMTGLDVARRLRASGFARTPMVALSASQGLLQGAFEAELFQGAIAKPFDVPDLLSCLWLTMARSCRAGTHDVHSLETSSVSGGPR